MHRVKLKLHFKVEVIKDKSLSLNAVRSNEVETDFASE
jgi:hypothetical protein